MRARDADVRVVQMFDKHARQFGIERIFSVRQMIRAAQPVRLAIQEKFIAARFEGAKADFVRPRIQDCAGI